MEAIFFLEKKDMKVALWSGHAKSFGKLQQSRQEARDRGQSWQKPNMTDSPCRKQKLADSFIITLWLCTISEAVQTEH